MKLFSIFGVLEIGFGSVINVVASVVAAISVVVAGWRIINSRSLLASRLGSLMDTRLGSLLATRTAVRLKSRTNSVFGLASTRLAVPVLDLICVLNLGLPLDWGSAKQETTAIDTAINRTTLNFMLADKGALNTHTHSQAEERENTCLTRLSASVRDGARGMTNNQMATTQHRSGS